MSKQTRWRKLGIAWAMIMVAIAGSDCVVFGEDSLDLVSPRRFLGWFDSVFDLSYSMNWVLETTGGDQSLASLYLNTPGTVYYVIAQEHITPPSAGSFTGKWPIGSIDNPMEGLYSLTAQLFTEAGGSLLVYLEEELDPAFGLDFADPEVAIESPTHGQYAMGEEVIADFRASDALSGIDSVESTVAHGQAIDTSTPGWNTFEVKATDKAGNEKKESVRYFVTGTGSTASSTPVGSPGDAFTTDFETGDLFGWTMTGLAFTLQPTKGDNPTARGREPSNHQGEWWIGGYEAYQGKPGQSPGDIGGDSDTGTLTSEPFLVQGSKIDFLIGGGNHPIGDAEGEAVVALVIDGQIVRSATGANSESMERVSWTVSQFIGQQAQLQIIDNHRGHWGHINCDDFRMLDASGTKIPFSSQGVDVATADPVGGRILLQESFEDARADGWDLQSGWRLHREPDGNHVLFGNGLWQWAHADGFTWTDYVVRFRVKVISGGVHMNCRVTYLNDRRTRYIIGLRENSTYISKEYPSDSYADLVFRRDQIPFAFNEWHEVEILVQGGRLTVTIDGVQQMDHTDDASPLLLGTIALETVDHPWGTGTGGSHVYVDDIEVRDLR